MGMQWPVWIRPCLGRWRMRRTQAQWLVLQGQPLMMQGQQLVMQGWRLGAQGQQLVMQGWGR